MNVYIKDKYTGAPVAGAQTLYTDGKFNPILILEPDFTDKEGRYAHDTGTSRYATINHPEYIPLNVEIPEIDSLQYTVQMEPLFGRNPGNKPEPEEVKDSPIMIIGVFALMGAATWWLLTS